MIAARALLVAVTAHVHPYAVASRIKQCRGGARRVALISEAQKRENKTM